MPPRASNQSSAVEISAILERVAAPVESSLPLPRLLVVLAHPDDEVLALGGRLERLAASRLLTVTDGTPTDGSDALQHGFPSLEAYRMARREELHCALRHAGLVPGLVAPMPSHAAVPVTDQTASMRLAVIVEAIADTIREFQPEALLTHPYEGGHPDHDACAFAAHKAARHHGLAVLEAPSYHAGPGGSMLTGTFLDGWVSPATWVCDLSPAEQARKRERLACFPSQAETLSQFSVTREIFRVAPAYDFSRAPHAGTLFYEQFPWGMRGEHFRVLAAAAEDSWTVRCAGDSQQEEASGAGQR